MEHPKGILVAIGGGEDKEDSKIILERVIELSGKEKPVVQVITTASNISDEVAGDYRSAFRDLGAVVKIADIQNREKASDQEILTDLKNCDIVYFSGGNQLKLTTILGGTGFLKVLKERYLKEKNFIIAGTSAGAAAMSSTMIVSGSSQDALIKGELQLNNGLDFINTLFIDTHFTQRGRFGRLIQTIAANPSVLGVGLGEDTAIIIYNNEMEVVGSGLVAIVDGITIKYSDLIDITDGSPITIEGLTLHVLSEGKRFDIEKRKLLMSVEEKQTR
ncbi:MAG: cyanophycinase [Bacteroidota bacterium]|jgi:cyanophycinase|nr:cyanophycinase [Bacteroidota bacterium]